MPIQQKGTMRSCFCPAPPSLSSENNHFQQTLNIHSPMKRNHSLLEYIRENDTQVSELGPSGPSSEKILHELWPFVTLGIFTLSAKYLNNLLELEP